MLEVRAGELRGKGGRVEAHALVLRRAPLPASPKTPLVGAPPALELPSSGEARPLAVGPPPAACPPRSPPPPRLVITPSPRRRREPAAAAAETPPPVQAQAHSRYRADFEELERLGSGGFGAVYKCRNRLDGELYVVKKIRLGGSSGSAASSVEPSPTAAAAAPHMRHSRRPSLAFDPHDPTAMLDPSSLEKLREVTAMARIKPHPNVVHYHTAWVEMVPVADVDPFLLRLGREDGSTFGGAGGGTAPGTAASSFKRSRSGFWDRETTGGEGEEEEEKEEEGGQREDGTGEERGGGSQERVEHPRPAAVTPVRAFGTPASIVPANLMHLGGFFDAFAAVSRLGFSPLGSPSCGSSVAASPAHSPPSPPPAAAGGAAAAGTRPRLAIRARAPPEAPAAPVPILHIQMELCALSSLEVWLARPDREVDEHEARFIMSQLWRGLHHVHSHGYVHRDLKPSNVFVSGGSGADGGVKMLKIGDFGLATGVGGLDEPGDRDVADTVEHLLASLVLGDEASAGGGGGGSDDEGDERGAAASPTWHERQLTSGVGTTMYAAPEQLRSQSYGQKADMFALGIIYVELHCPPFSTRMERCHVLGDARRGRLPPGMEEAFPQQAELARLLLSQNPDDRPASGDLYDDPAPATSSAHGLTPRSCTPTAGYFSGPSTPRRSVSSGTAAAEAHHLPAAPSLQLDGAASSAGPFSGLFDVSPRVRVVCAEMAAVRDASSGMQMSAAPFSPMRSPMLEPSLPRRSVSQPGPGVSPALGAAAAAPPASTAGGSSTRRYFSFLRQSPPAGPAASTDRGSPVSASTCSGSSRALHTHRPVPALPLRRRSEDGNGASPPAKDGMSPLALDPDASPPQLCVEDDLRRQIRARDEEITRLRNALSAREE